MGDGQGFQIAYQILQSRVAPRLFAVEDILPETASTFDFVLFPCVLYHPQNPLRYLRIVRSACGEMVTLGMHIDALDYPRPAKVFHTEKAPNNDALNFWGPNLKYLDVMVPEIGFKKLIVFPSYQPARIVNHAHVKYAGQRCGWRLHE